MDKFSEFIPYLVPVLVIQVALLLAALLDLIRRQHTRGPKWAWALVILFINIIGPILYFAIGRADEA